MIRIPGTKFIIPKPTNEPTLAYTQGSPERADLLFKLKEMKARKLDIPLIIEGKEIRTGNLRKSIVPHDHDIVLAEFHNAGIDETHLAIDAALQARTKWASTPWYDRAAVFLKAANLLAGPWRSTMNAAAMLDLSKNVHQAEIDAADELIDFLRFNVYYMQEIYRMQVNSPPGEWDRMEYRPLEGFIFAVSPFNFVSIMGNLPSAPAMMGNTVVWKPSSSAIYAAFHVMRVFIEAGLPPGVINFLPGPGSKVGDIVLKHPSLAGVHFTGSTETFTGMWKTIAENLETYRTFPRMVGETGGKDFVFVHNSARVDQLVTALIRGSFEFQGQKCSAASRSYIPRSLWPSIKETLLHTLSHVKIGDIEDFSTLVNAVIDKGSYNRIASYIDYVRQDPESEIIFGGNHDATKGYFIEPTVVLTTNPLAKTMEEEIFGPILTIYVYPDDEYEETLKICDETSPYGLTGSIFATDREAIVIATEYLVNAAGNFYINDKPTGAVVGRQPFGGARKSGTNDKAGSQLNLMRWVSPRTIKENFVPPIDFRYPHMRSN